MTQRTAMVIGAGVTGLVAARTLAADGVSVTVIERSDRVGGQVRTVDLAGHRVDVGAEAIHLAGQDVTDLLDELGLGPQLVLADATWTWLWSRRGLRRLPAGMGPTGPTRLWPLARSGVIGPGGCARAAMEPLIARTGARRRVSDQSVGEFLRRRFGRAVVEELVDPLLGGLHAGDIWRLGVAGATPYLAEAAKGGRSLLIPRRGVTGASGPKFASFSGGLETLVDELIDHPRIDVRTGCRAESVATEGSGVAVQLDDGSMLGADGVVLAVPARAAGGILAAGDLVLSPTLRGLAGLNTASVVTVSVAVPRDAIEALPAFGATGILVPSARGRFLKAATFLSRKWEHVGDPTLFLLRMSAGRAHGPDPTTLADEDLLDRLLADLADATGLRCEPGAIHIERWPNTMAQLEVGHRERLNAIRDALPGDGRIVLGGAPYDGVGIASCIRSGRTAARALAPRRTQSIGTST